MTEASRVQKMLNEQNEWIDRLKSQVMRLELELVGYRVRNKQLEAALREIAAGYETEWSTSTMGNMFDVAQILSERINIARKALEGKDD